MPEFQRELILTDEWMKSLLASVSLGYPIGAVMLLEAGTTEMRFKTSPVADPPPPREPERLLIDGRRRITGLYQALASGRPVQTRDGRDEPVQRWYFIDIAAALDPAVDRDEAIISVPELSGRGVGAGAIPVPAAPGVRRAGGAGALAGGIRQPLG